MAMAVRVFLLIAQMMVAVLKVQCIQTPKTKHALNAQLPF
jgi:hypothetical protein